MAKYRKECYVNKKIEFSKVAGKIRQRMWDGVENSTTHIQRRLPMSNLYSTRNTFSEQTAVLLFVSRRCCYNIQDVGVE